jgi:uncharacterized protein
MPFTDNTERQRFELEQDGYVAYAEYRLVGNILQIPHVYAPPELRGTGVAGTLMRHVLEHARSQHWKVAPICSYASTWMERHPEFHSLRA